MEEHPQFEHHSGHDVVSPSKPKRLFPLHLTPFEYYMDIEDRSRYPMTFVVQFEFSGSVNRDSMETALDVALDRHPLLQAILRTAKQNSECWVLADEKIRIDWGGLDDDIEFVDDEFIDLRKEPGLRIWIRHDSKRAVLTSQFHHAVCDGIGSYQFLGDMLAVYTRETGGSLEEELPQLDASTLRLRGKSSYDPQQFRDNRGRFRSEFGEWMRLLFGRVSPLRPVKRSAYKSKSSFPSIQSVTFDKSVYRKIRLAAADLGQTPNDMLVEKLFISLQQWNKRQGAGGWGRWLSVMMPMDLRESAQQMFPAANIVSYALIRRKCKVVRDAKALRDGLREELASLKRNRHSTRFMNMVASAPQRPFAMKATLAGERCFSTAVLSNTGDPTKRFYVQFPREKGAVRCGNLLLKRISGVPPMRPKTRASISIFTYRRELTICVRCDRHHFTPSDTQAFVDMYAENVRRILEPSSK